MSDHDSMTDMSTAQCWAMLREEEFGRLAFRLVDEVHITPINYAADGETLLFRTAEGEKLLGVVMGSVVAFEIDRYGEETGAASWCAGSALAWRGRGTPSRERAAEAVGRHNQVQRGGDPPRRRHRAGVRAAPPVDSPPPTRPRIGAPLPAGPSGALTETVGPHPQAVCMLCTVKQPFALAGLANRVLIPILRSRAGRQLGRRLAVVEYLGRRSGQHRQLVTQYTLEGRTVRIRVGVAARKTWWRNFTSPHLLRLRLAGDEYAVTGHVEREGELIRVVADLDAPAPGLSRRRSASHSGDPVRQVGDEPGEIASPGFSAGPPHPAVAVRTRPKHRSFRVRSQLRTRALGRSGRPSSRQIRAGASPCRPVYRRRDALRVPAGRQPVEPLADAEVGHALARPRAYGIGAGARTAQRERVRRSSHHDEVDKAFDGGRRQ